MSEPQEDLAAVEDTEYLFRSLLMRLQFVDSSLPSPPKDSTFTVLLHARNDILLRNFVTNPESGWVDVSSDRVARDASQPLLFPGKRVATPLVNFDFNIFVTQHRGATIGSQRTAS